MLYKGVWRTRDVIQAGKYVANKSVMIMSDNHSFALDIEDQGYRDLACAVVAQAIMDYLDGKHFSLVGERLYLRPMGMEYWMSEFESLSGYLWMSGVKLDGEELLRFVLENGKRYPDKEKLKRKFARVLMDN